MNPEEATAAGIPESAQQWDEVANSTDATVFWDRMTNMRSKIGTGLYQPGEDAGDEDWSSFVSKASELSGGRLMSKPNFDNAEQSNDFYATLGRPEKPDGYEFEAIEGMELDGERQAFLSGIAHEAGLTKSQFKALDAQIRKADLTQIQAQQEAFTGELGTLKQEWGLAFDDRINQARKVVDAFFPHIAKDTPLSAVEIKAFHSLAKQLGTNSSEFKDHGRQQNTVTSPAEAVTMISEMRNNPKHPYNNPQDPAHNEAKKKMRSLYLAKNGQA